MEKLVVSAQGSAARAGSWQDAAGWVAEEGLLGDCKKPCGLRTAAISAVTASALADECERIEPPAGDGLSHTQPILLLQASSGVVGGAPGKLAHRRSWAASARFARCHLC